MVVVRVNVTESWTMGLFWTQTFFTQALSTWQGLAVLEVRHEHRVSLRLVVVCTMCFPFADPTMHPHNVSIQSP